MDIISTIIVYAIPVILAITLHEAAHGFAAKMCGDNTAWVLGRVTLNPVAHIDTVGTIVLPGALLLGGLLVGTTPAVFGWAKPVPVNFRRLRNPKRDMVIVSAAGPLSNLAQAIVWALVAKLVILLTPPMIVGDFLLNSAIAGISVNIFLMALNLLPILPLDGGRILEGFLPYQLSYKYAQTERYGMIVLLVLMASGLLGPIVRPIARLGSMIVGLIV